MRQKKEDRRVRNESDIQIDRKTRNKPNQQKSYSSRKPMAQIGQKYKKLRSQRTQKIVSKHSQDKQDRQTNLDIVFETISEDLKNDERFMMELIGQKGYGKKEMQFNSNMMKSDEDGDGSDAGEVELNVSQAYSFNVSSQDLEIHKESDPDFQ